MAAMVQAAAPAMSGTTAAPARLSLPSRIASAMRTAVAAAATAMSRAAQAVRPARRSATFGVILLFVPVVVLLFFMPEGGDTLLLIGCIAALIFGVILLVNYFSVTIYYDDEKFLYKTLRGGKKEFHYSQIRGQRSLMTRGGINTILFVGDEEINLYSAMQNLNAFLSKAFFKWCAAKGIDPDSVENNPRMFTWFPDPEKPAKT